MPHLYNQPGVPYNLAGLPYNGGDIGQPTTGRKPGRVVVLPHLGEEYPEPGRLWIDFPAPTATAGAAVATMPAALFAECGQHAAQAAASVKPMAAEMHFEAAAPSPSAGASVSPIAAAIALMATDATAKGRSRAREEEERAITGDPEADPALLDIFGE